MPVRNCNHKMLLTFMKTVLKLEWEQLILRVEHKFKWRPDNFQIFWYFLHYFLRNSDSFRSISTPQPLSFQHKWKKKLMRQQSEAVNDQLYENPIAFIVVASSLRLSLIKLYFLFVVILTDCNLVNLWCVLLIGCIVQMEAMIGCRWETVITKWYLRSWKLFWNLFVVILTDCNLVNLWCVLLLNYFELTKLSGFNFMLFWFLEVHLV
jgi:hypothetical protein